MNKLTPREQQCLRLLGEGWCDKAIAAQMGIAVRTVKQYLTAAYRALDLSQPGRSPRVMAALWVQGQ